MEALNRMYGYKRECYVLLHLNSGIVLFVFTDTCCSFFFSLYKLKTNISFQENKDYINYIFASIMPTHQLMETQESQYSLMATPLREEVVTGPMAASQYAFPAVVPCTVPMAAKYVFPAMVVHHAR